MGRLFCVVLFFFAFSSCEDTNIMEFTEDKASNNSLLFKMQNFIDNFNFDAAIAVFVDEMKPVQQSTRGARELYGHAYSGKCGLDFVRFVNDVTDASSSFFNTLLESIADSTALQIDDCNTAESIIDENMTNLGATTKDYNMSLLNSMVKMGAIMNVYGAAADNTLDAGFDPCDVNDISDTDMEFFVAALSRMLSSIDESSLNFFSSFGIDAVCGAGEPLELSGLCEPIDAADVTPAQICASRALMNEGQDGIGLATCPGDIIACLCAGCPL